MSFLGRNIKKIRTARRISQTEFAKLFDLKRTTVGAYEEGRAEAKTETLIKIAEYFKLSIDALLRKELTVNDIFGINQKLLEPRIDFENIPLFNADFFKKIDNKDKAYIKILSELNLFLASADFFSSYFPEYISVKYLFFEKIQKESKESFNFSGFYNSKFYYGASEAGIYNIFSKANSKSLIFSDFRILFRITDKL